MALQSHLVDESQFVTFFGIVARTTPDLQTSLWMPPGAGRSGSCAGCERVRRRLAWELEEGSSEARQTPAPWEGLNQPGGPRPGSQAGSAELQAGDHHACWAGSPPAPPAPRKPLQALAREKPFLKLEAAAQEVLGTVSARCPEPSGEGLEVGLARVFSF